MNQITKGENSIMTKHFCLAVAVFFVFASSVFGQYDVPYVPTDYAVVDSMLSVAQVTKDDILYDLGCGDGRIVITAAKRYGTHAIGIDINPWISIVFPGLVFMISAYILVLNYRSRHRDGVTLVE